MAGQLLGIAAIGGLAAIVYCSRGNRRKGIEAVDEVSDGKVAEEGVEGANLVAEDSSIAKARPLTWQADEESGGGPCEVFVDALVQDIKINTKEEKSWFDM